MFRVVMTWVSSHQCFLPQVLLNLKVLAIFKTHLPSIREAVCSSLLHYHVGKFCLAGRCSCGALIEHSGELLASLMQHGTNVELFYFRWVVVVSSYIEIFAWDFRLNLPQKSESKLGRVTSRMQLNNWRAFVDRSMFVCKPVKHNFVNKY